MQRRGGLATLIAAAAAAYGAADLAHEGLGHGGACLALGGQLRTLSTTYADCAISSRVIDGAGPVAGIAVALIAWIWLRWTPPRAYAARAFLCCLYSFAIFWNVGYLVKSGLFDAGDWAYVIRGLQPVVFWHVVLVVGGGVLYAIAMRLLAQVMRNELSGPGKRTPRAFALIAYGTAAVLSVAAAAFDPRGPSTILNDALPSSLGAVGLAYVGWMMGRREPDLRLAETGSVGWMLSGLIAAGLFVGVLGPGLRF